MGMLSAFRAGALLPVAAWVVMAGCTAVASTDSGDSSDSGAGGGAASCSSRCATLANQCKTDPSQCTQFCAGATAAELSCVEQAQCDGPKSQACLKSGGTSTATSGAGGAGSNSCGGLTAGGAPETGYKVTCQCTDGTNATGCKLPDSTTACGTACLDDDCDPSKCTKN